jgi:hypothetical protein
MCDLEFSFYDIDDLAIKASDLLDQFRDRGMPDTIHRKVLDKTYDADNLEKLRDLVAKFKAAIEAHDAKVAAAQAALSAHESLAMEHMDSDNHSMHASFSESPFSTAIPSSGATNGNPNGTEGNTTANSQESQPKAVPGASRCTIKLSRPHNRDRRHLQAAQPATLVAAARSSNAGRKPSAEIRCHQEAFRQFAFQEGIRVMRTGRIEQVTIRDLLRAFKERHLAAPPSLKSIIARPQWLEAVRANDISKLVRHVSDRAFGENS